MTRTLEGELDRLDARIDRLSDLESRGRHGIINMVAVIAIILVLAISVVAMMTIPKLYATERGVEAEERPDA